MALVFFFVKLQSPGPAVFRQARMGRGEKVFVCYKFRSMYVGADASPAAPKLAGDPNVTPFGSFIRRWSLDELPQLFNVLKGDMSLVGPRPLPLRDHEKLGPVGRERLVVTPGLTGLWQVSGRSLLTHREMAALDLLYIENLSLGTDLRILLRTFGAVFRGKGAY